VDGADPAGADAVETAAGGEELREAQEATLTAKRTEMARRAVLSIRGILSARRFAGAEKSLGDRTSEE
jgi:hypothetical protein